MEWGIVIVKPGCFVRLTTASSSHLFRKSVVGPGSWGGGLYIRLSVHLTPILSTEIYFSISFGSYIKQS